MATESGGGDHHVIQIIAGFFVTCLTVLLAIVKWPWANRGAGQVDPAIAAAVQSKEIEHVKETIAEIKDEQTAHMNQTNADFTDLRTRQTRVEEKLDTLLAMAQRMVPPAAS